MLPSTIFKDWNMSTTQNDVKAINGWWCIFCLDLCVNVYTVTMYIYINFDVWPQNAVNVKSDILGNKPNSYCYMWRVSSKRRTALIHKTGHEWTSHQLQPANPTSTQCTRAKTIHNFQLPKLSPTLEQRSISSMSLYYLCISDYAYTSKSLCLVSSSFELHQHHNSINITKTNTN